MKNIQIVKDSRFTQLFLKHCLAECPSLVDNEESAKSTHYFEEDCEDSLAFNDFLKKSYVFFTADEGIIGIHNEQFFLLDSENSLIYLGTNPLMLVKELNDDECHYGFHDILDYEIFKTKYTAIFGQAEENLTNELVEEYYSNLGFDI